MTRSYSKSRKHQFVSTFIGIILTSIVLEFPSNSHGMHQAMAAEKPFYRGGEDQNKSIAPNGAIVNADYKENVHRYYGQARIINVSDRVHSIVGYGISNLTFIEGPTGLIVFDAGNSYGQGKELLAMIRTITKAPIAALIYSHHHYTGGARAFIEDTNSQNIPIFGHPDLERTLKTTTGLLGPMQSRRASIQLGAYLPKEGPDASYTPPKKTFKDPELNSDAHVRVNRPVKDGEEVQIAGLSATFYHVVADTRDSLMVHFPDLDLVLHNTAVVPFAFSLYTLRGDFYRNPDELIASIDKIRSLKPQVLVGCHGTPLTTREEVVNVTTAHRDYYSFLYQQSIRAINQGLTPNQMVQAIKIPESLRTHPWLFPAYIDPEYIIRGFYRGIVGWFAEDTADLHPPSPQEVGEVIVKGFGGSDVLIGRAEVAFAEAKYNLAAKLVTFVLDAYPDHRDARLLKAKALRAMAQTTKSGVQTRNFMLTHALHLEGKLDWTAPPPSTLIELPTTESLANSEPSELIQTLAVRLNAEKSQSIKATVEILFSDLQQSFGFKVRRGVFEYIDHTPDGADITLEISRLTWTKLVQQKIQLAEAMAEGLVKVEGNGDLLKELLEAFAPVSGAPEISDI